MQIYIALHFFTPLHGIHGCQEFVVRIWQDLAKTAKMLVRGSTRAVWIENACGSLFQEASAMTTTRI